MRIQFALTLIEIKLEVKHAIIELQLTAECVLTYNSKLGSLMAHDHVYNHVCNSLSDSHRKCTNVSIKSRITAVTVIE